MATVFRLLLCGIVGSAVGGGVGFGLSMLFITTSLSDVLGPRYAEFDFFGVLGVAIIAAIVACPISVVVASMSVNAVLAGIWTVIVCTLLLGLGWWTAIKAVADDGEWAWLGLIHVSVCLGVLAATWISVPLSRSRNSPDEQGDS